MNRNPALFAAAITWAQRGGWADMTTSNVPAFFAAGSVKPSRGLARMLEAGVDPSRITFTSDGQGSLPDYDDEGRLLGLDVGRVASLLEEVRDAVLVDGVPLPVALGVATRNPARALGLARKGVLAEGRDADVVLLRKRRPLRRHRDRAGPRPDARRPHSRERDLRAMKSAFGGLTLSLFLVSASAPRSQGRTPRRVTSS